MERALEEYELLAAQQFKRREEALFHPTYDEELKYYEMVKAGNIEALDQKKDWDMIDMPERGVLSKDYLQNIKYHIVIAITMITRFCIEGGLDEKDAYYLSDIYINKVDEKKTAKSLIEVHKEMTYAFAKRMKKLKTKTNHSVHCTKALDYIYDHLHENIQIVDIADFVGLNETYISKLFFKEMGQNIGSFIRQQKINEAKNMLTYSSVSCADIAQYLSFSSSSHFSQNFKKETGMTPLEYRNQHYRKHW